MTAHYRIMWDADDENPYIDNPGYVVQEPDGTTLFRRRQKWRTILCAETREQAEDMLRTMIFAGKPRPDAGADDCHYYDAAGHLVAESKPSTPNGDGE